MRADELLQWGEEPGPGEGKGKETWELKEPGLGMRGLCEPHPARPRETTPHQCRSLEAHASHPNTLGG